MFNMHNFFLVFLDKYTYKPLRVLLNYHAGKMPLPAPKNKDWWNNEESFQSFQFRG